MASIRIAEVAHTRDGRGAEASGVGGIYPARSRTPSDRRSLRARTRSLDRRGSLRLADTEGGEDEDSGLRLASDFKTKQVFKGRVLLWLAYQSIGVIYGDIGTSPLYVFSSTFTSAPSYEDLVGVLSIVIWSLTMMVTVKYVLVILRADNEGEGGTFSTYSLLSRFAHITQRDPREASLIKMERYQTVDLQTPTRHLRSALEKSAFLRVLLKVIGVLAVSMVMSDGVLTPAQSVLGAVQGLNVVKPDIDKSTVIGTTCGILVLLFLIQPFGTANIAMFFAPIVIIWLGFNATFGVYNLAKFDYTVLKAFSPSYAFEFLARHKTEGWRQLGGVLLAFTGVEALFADLGAFSRRAIQLSWLCYAFPCLLLAYTGQAAYISVHPEAYSNPFFKSAPPGTLYPSLVIAILAAIVASQAIITATFQLMAQIMKLSYFPQVKVVHTSKVFYGQLYVPFLNWIMMVATVLVAAIFNNTTSLGNAYGVCVMFVTFFDTCMVSLAALIVWRLHPIIVFIPWLTISCLDGLYLSSALTKVPSGAWFTLTISGILACLFILWRFGKEQQWQAEAEDRFPTNRLIKKDSDGRLMLTDTYGNGVISPIRGFGIFFDKAGEMTPAVFSQFVSKLVATPEIMVFFHLRPLETPTIPAEQRYTVSRLGIPNCYRVVVRHGYMDVIITPDLASLVCEQVRHFLIRQHTSKVSNLGSNSPATVDIGTDIPTPRQDSSSISNSNSNNEKSSQLLDEKLANDLSRLQSAYEHQVLYIIGKEQMKIRAGTGLVRSILLTAFLWIRDNTRNKIANLRVPTDKIVEVGFIKEV
ncbi:potassium transporter-domain-containing protein [Xylogone sp. PMI_703]|nr:potassium transporter-domain-containing protein [Xylogone sp. PMI_703]